MAPRYDRYLEALELVKRWDKGTNLDDAIRLFHQAAAEDPSFALAFARLADAERIKYALTHDKAWLAEAGKSADEAVRLNPGLGPVQVALGRIHGMRGSNDLAFAAFDRAIQLAEAERKESPRDASLHSQLALYYAKTRKPQVSLQRLSTALTLSPGTGQIQADAAEVYELLGMREKAVAALRRSLDLGFQRQQLLRNPELSRLFEDSRMK